MFGQLKAQVAGNGISSDISRDVFNESGGFSPHMVKYCSMRGCGLLCFQVPFVRQLNLLIGS